MFFFIFFSWGFKLHVFFLRFMHGKVPYTNDFLAAGVLSRSVSIAKGDLVFHWMGSCLLIESFEENNCKSLHSCGSQHSLLLLLMLLLLLLLLLWFLSSSKYVYVYIHVNR